MNVKFISLVQRWQTTLKFWSLLEEGKLSEAVRQYPFLHNKAHKGYKERDAVTNAWEELAKELDFLENGNDF